MLILNKNDLEFVTQLPCLLEHPVDPLFYLKCFCRVCTILLKIIRINAKSMALQFKIEILISSHSKTKKDII